MLKDKEARKEAAKLRKRKQRMSHPEPAASTENVTPGEMSHLGPVTPDITLNNVTPDVTPLAGGVLRLEPQIIRANPPQAADVVANFKPESRTSGYARFGPQRPLKGDLVSPSIPEHRRRRGGLKMGFEPGQQVSKSPGEIPPELDADDNPIPDD
ncbi:hypothetical protein LCGC14_0651420 [marine sediment metagenome]|uniref:Uncharacterized protein n=1 Tax=marine sediment metagenome TaxID=412755 RepID=A0A0F9RG07_9ZZZZ